MSLGGYARVLQFIPAFHSHQPGTIQPNSFPCFFEYAYITIAQHPSLRALPRPPVFLQPDLCLHVPLSADFILPWKPVAPLAAKALSNKMRSFSMRSGDYSMQGGYLLHYFMPQIRHPPNIFQPARSLNRRVVGVRGASWGD